ncbi:hypothetical protein [Bradyrhizobium cosmicum]|uniref:hypothetical protein n=1 Tax=Bradyrhizobium cosmicum TaxID=1404864 RepID=UPI0028EB11AE|nr:hypothetical protein [Bradyrhizobium cosmicum]
MQKFFDPLNANDRRIVRKWRLATLGFYGSILFGMILYAALRWNPDVNYALADSAARAKIVGASGSSRPGPVSP